MSLKTRVGSIPTSGTLENYMSTERTQNLIKEYLDPRYQTIASLLFGMIGSQPAQGDLRITDHTAALNNLADFIAINRSQLPRQSGE